MKKYVFILLCLFFIGCAGSDFESVMDHPHRLVQDPHFAQYQSKRDQLESQYLHKEITYAEYKERQKELEAKYEYEVENREKILGDYESEMR